MVVTEGSWNEKWTEKEKWIGGKDNISILDGLKHHLEDDFILRNESDLPYIKRDHYRKY